MGYSQVRAITVQFPRVPSSQTNYALCFDPTRADILASNISSSTTTIPLTTGLQTNNGDTIQIDSEQMLVLSGGGTTSLTVTRGYHSTTAASHTAGAAIMNMFLADVAHGGSVTSVGTDNGLHSGYDIIFASDSAGAFPIPFERVYWNGDGTSEWHVLIAALSNTTNTVIYVLYGNSAISTDQASPNAVWDANYSAVYHMQRAGQPQPSSIFLDSTSNDISFTPEPFCSNVPAEIGNGCESADDTQYSSTTDPPTDLSPLVFSGGDSITVEVWIKRITLTPGKYQALAAVTTSDLNTIKRNWMVSFSGAGLGEVQDAFELVYRDSSNSQWQAFAHTSADNDTSAFHHYAVTFTFGTGSSIKLYKDGVLLAGSWTSGSGNVSPWTTSVDKFYIANSGQNFGIAETLEGIYDELRISKGVERSGSWIQTCVNNQSSPSTFYALGPGSVRRLFNFASFNPGAVQPESANSAA